MPEHIFSEDGGYLGKHVSGWGKRKTGWRVTSEGAAIVPSRLSHGEARRQDTGTDAREATAPHPLWVRKPIAHGSTCARHASVISASIGKLAKHPVTRATGQTAPITHSRTTSSTDLRQTLATSTLLLLLSRIHPTALSHRQSNGYRRGLDRKYAAVRL